MHACSCALVCMLHQLFLFGCLFVTISLYLSACCPPTYVTNHIREKHVLQSNSVMVIMLSSVCVFHLIFPLHTLIGYLNRV